MPIAFYWSYRSCAEIGGTMTPRAPYTGKGSRADWMTEYNLAYRHNTRTCRSTYQKMSGEDPHCAVRSSWGRGGQSWCISCIYWVCQKQYRSTGIWCYRSIQRVRWGRENRTEDMSLSWRLLHATILWCRITSSMYEYLAYHGSILWIRACHHWEIQSVLGKNEQCDIPCRFLSWSRSQYRIRERQYSTSPWAQPRCIPHAHQIRCKEVSGLSSHRDSEQLEQIIDPITNDHIMSGSINHPSPQLVTSNLAWYEKVNTLRWDVAQDTADALEWSNHFKKADRKTKAHLKYANLGAIEWFRKELWTFLDEAYPRIKNQLDKTSLKKKIPWQRILSRAITEWNKKHPDKAVASYYTKESSTRKSLHLWEKNYGIRTIEDAFSVFWAWVEDDTPMRYYLSKNEIVAHKREIGLFMQQYIDNLGGNIWRRRNQPWHHTVSNTIWMWNATYPKRMIYNYMSLGVGRKMASWALWREKYGIRTRKEVLEFFGITLPEKNK